ILQLVRLQLGQQADATALVAAQVEPDAAAALGDLGHGGVQLCAAVAPLRAEDVAGQALGVDADKDVLSVAGVTVPGVNVTEDEGEVLRPVDVGAVAVGTPLAVGVGDHRLRAAGDQALGAATVLDELL